MRLFLKSVKPELGNGFEANQFVYLRPINLCNVLYKIVSKVLANRLKKILPDIVLPTQSAFVPGSLISDNILIAYEMTHFLMNKQEGEMCYATIMLDMSTAYDQVELSFLKDMMVLMGFLRWIELIMECVIDMSCSVKLKELLSTSFPLPLYLFLLCAEEFSALLNTAVEEWRISGVKICPGAPSVSHLLFAKILQFLFTQNRRGRYAATRYS